MKKYYSKYCGYILIPLTLGIILLAFGIIACIFLNEDFFNIKLLLTSFGFITVFVSLPLYFAEKSRWIAVYNGMLYLPRGVRTVKANGKSAMCTKRTLLKINEISAVKKELHNGDGIISKDTYFYFFKTIKGEKYCLTLCSYKKEGIDEIMAELSENGVNIVL